MDHNKEKIVLTAAVAKDYHSRDFNEIISDLIEKCISLLLKFKPGTTWNVYFV